MTEASTNAISPLKPDVDHRLVAEGVAMQGNIVEIEAGEGGDAGAGR